MKIEKRKISELIKAEYNPRKISVVQLYELKEGIEEFGLVQPLVVNENPERKNVIVGGHQRLKIWEELGNKEVDCSIVNLQLDKERKLNIKLNKNGGTFDDDLLKEFFDYEELIEWGFTVSELFDMDETEIKGNIEDDEIPEVKESRVVMGDIWKLGEHRIMCGDSTSLDDVEKLMNGEKADMVFTSPPYNGDTHLDLGKGGGRLYNDKEMDNKTSKDYITFLQSTLDNILLYTNGFIFWNINYNAKSRNEYLKHLFPYLDFLWETIIWEKTGMPIVYGLTRNCEFIFVLKNGKDKHIGKHFETNHNLWKVSNLNSQDKINNHRACFPVELPNKAINLVVNANSVLDPFLGSGTTLIAAEKLKRKCYGMELDEKYCDVIIERWEQFTGQKAEKING
tara:strand:+ start:157 stop:1344 length:1188 start_codon:yes stop_codon:yes gene_type:complete